MCGICGFNWDDKRLLKQMLGALHHRGPDSNSYFCNGKISLGHALLSIASDNNKQPIYNEDRTLVLVCNGEIFNHYHLKNVLEKRGHRFSTDSDCEVIIHLYEEYPKNLFDYLDGQFAFALYDQKVNKLFLGRDPFGIKPLYYYKKGDSIIFASEVKSILLHDIPRKLNRGVLSLYLRYRYNLTDLFPIINIYSVHQGEFIEISNKKNNVISKNHFSNSNRLDLNKNKLFVLLNETISSQIPDNKKISLFLSGGLDSSTLLYFLNKSENPIHTFTAVTDYELENDDVYYSRKISYDYNTSHNECYVSLEDIKNLPKIIKDVEEPVSDPSSIAMDLLASKSNSVSKVVFSGDGGDELFGGYTQDMVWNYIHTYKSLFNYQLRKSLFNPMIKWLVLSDRAILIKNLLGNLPVDSKDKEKLFDIISSGEFMHDYKDLISVFDSKEMSYLFLLQGVNPLNNHKKYIESMRDVYLYELNYKLKNQILLLSDKINMSHSLECRVPFITRGIANITLSLSPNMKINYFSNKVALRKTMAGKLPKYIVNRKKYHFSMPLYNWYKNGLDSILQDVLSKDSVIDDGLFNYNFIENVLKNVEKSPNFYLRQLWGVFTASIWYRYYINNESVKII